MGHVPSLCVLCLAIAPLQSMYGRELEKNTYISTARGRGGVNLIYLPNTGWDVS